MSYFLPKNKVNVTIFTKHRSLINWLNEFTEKSVEVAMSVKWENEFFQVLFQHSSVPFIMQQIPQQ